jgi:hypothetical protein
MISKVSFPRRRESSLTVGLLDFRLRGNDKFGIKGPMAALRSLICAIRVIRG